MSRCDLYQKLRVPCQPMSVLSRGASTLACHACLAHRQKTCSATDGFGNSIQPNPASLQIKIVATYRLLALRIPGSHFRYQGGVHQQAALLHQPEHPISSAHFAPESGCEPSTF